MKKTLFILIIFLNFSYLTFSQENIAQERIFVHQNTSFLITGEYLYYKVYCINNETNNLSNFSKIAYVELINSNRNTVFKHKIILKNGIGNGDYFIPTSLNSGNYKIIAYTQWMRNSDIQNFYQNDISIINPFQENQKSILNDPSFSQNNNISIDSNKTRKEESIDNKYFSLQINPKSFATRKKVTLNIHALMDGISYGNYSISVRKIDNLKIPVRNTSTTYMNSFKNKTSYSSPSNNPVEYLPELRGELLTGSVVLKENGSPANNIKVALSIPGKNYLFKIANTNKKGIYYFNIGEEYDYENANFQILDSDRDKYTLIIDKQLSLDYSGIDFFNFTINPSEKDLILMHSIANQIENAYAIKKLDSIKSLKTITPFFSNKSTDYVLDDYTRFKTLKETFIEIIPEVYSRQRNGVITFHVRIYGKEIESGLSPLVLVDGILIQDQTELFDFESSKIEKISVVDDMYMYGSKLFEGIISISTFNGDFQSSVSNDAIKNTKLSKPLVSKKYFNQVYNDQSKTVRIPDFRRQLLWIPELKLQKTDTNITFYTSDIYGDFEICLEGFTLKGQPVSLRQVITVKKPKK